MKGFDSLRFKACYLPFPIETELRKEPQLFDHFNLILQNIYTNQIHNFVPKNNILGDRAVISSYSGWHVFELYH